MALLNQTSEAYYLGADGVWNSGDEDYGDYQFVSLKDMVNNFMIAYTYSYQSNSVVFNNGGFHQLSLGINFGCKKEKYDCNCPGIN